MRKVDKNTLTLIAVAAVWVVGYNGEETTIFQFAQKKRGSVDTFDISHMSYMLHQKTKVGGSLNST